VACIQGSHHYKHDLVLSTFKSPIQVHLYVCLVNHFSEANNSTTAGFQCTPMKLVLTSVNNVNMSAMYCSHVKIVKQMSKHFLNNSNLNGKILSSMLKSRRLPALINNCIMQFLGTVYFSVPFFVKILMKMLMLQWILFFLSWSLTLDQKNNRLSLWDLTIILGKSHPLGRLNLKFCACLLRVSFILCQWQSVNCKQTTCKFLCWQQFLWLCASSQLFPCSLISMLFQNYGNIYIQYFVTSDRQTV